MRDKVLIVDDSKFNRQVLVDQLKNDYGIIEAADGKEALQIMEKSIGEIAALLLDVVMPEMDGIDVLREMSERGYIGHFPVIMVTAEQSINLVGECFDYGISDFIRKPIDTEFVKDRVKHFVELYIQKNNFQSQVEKQTATLRSQYKILQEVSEQLKDSNDRIIGILGTIVECRNLEGGSHLLCIKKYTELVANKLREIYPELGLTKEKIKIIVAASALHDVGKIMIPDSILLKPGELSREEFDVIKSHSLHGFEIIDKISQDWQPDYVEVCKEITRSHHEKYDGKGYPDGLVGDDIPLSAQIVAIVDCYDALTNETIYKKAFSFDTAFHMIVQGECGVFNPKLLGAFRMVKEEIEAFGKANRDELEESDEKYIPD